MRFEAPQEVKGYSFSPQTRPLPTGGRQNWRPQAGGNFKHPKSLLVPNTVTPGLAQEHCLMAYDANIQNPGPPDQSPRPGHIQEQPEMPWWAKVAPGNPYMAQTLFPRS